MTDPQGSPSNPFVLQSVTDAVATLTLNRPDRLNALNHQLGHELVEALHRLAEDRAVRAIVLTGAGRGFCSGGDLNLLTSARNSNDSAQLQSLLEIGKQIVLIIAGMKKPVIAAVNGPAAGAGMNLALACTLRIASESATFSESFARIGLFPDFGGTYLLPRIVGAARAAELFYTAETVSAPDALKLGIVSHIFPQETLAQEAASLAARLAAAPPLVAHGINQALFSDERAALEQALDREIRWQKLCFSSEDCREGLQAFFEKRPPHFRGS